MTDKEAISSAFKTQHYATTMVSLIDSFNPFVPTANGEVKSVQLDPLNLIYSLTVVLAPEFRVDTDDNGIREVSLVEVYKAHFINLN